MPIIAKIAARKDESIVETLAESLPNILKHIGLFSSDNDIKVNSNSITLVFLGTIFLWNTRDSFNEIYFKGLLKTFVKNLHSDMPEIRRAAAFSIIAVCKYSRQPEYFFPYVLTTVLGNHVISCTFFFFFFSNSFESYLHSNEILSQTCCMNVKNRNRNPEISYKVVYLVSEIFYLMYPMIIRLLIANIIYK